jgi:hypothetical protein
VKEETWEEGEEEVPHHPAIHHFLVKPAIRAPPGSQLSITPARPASDAGEADSYLLLGFAPFTSLDIGFTEHQQCPGQL